MLIQNVIYIPTILSMLVIGVFVFLKNPRDSINRIFALFTTAVTLWLIGLYIADTSNGGLRALYGVRAAIFFATMIPLFFVYFSSVFPDYRRMKVYNRMLLATPTVVFMVLSITSLMVTAVEKRDLVADPTSVGTAYTAFFIYFVSYFALGVFTLMRKYRQASSRQKYQIRFTILGTVAAVLANIILSFILVIAGTSSVTKLLGGPSTLLFVGALSYAIVKHRLFDIRLVVARSVAYLLLLATLGVVYSGAIFGISNIFFPSAVVTTAQQLVYVGIAIVVAFTFQPLRRFFERLTDSVLYRDRYEIQEVVNKLSTVLASQIDIEIIINSSLKIIGDTLKLTHGRLVVLDAGKTYRSTDYGKPVTSQEAQIKQFDGLHDNLLLADEIETGEHRTLMQQYDIAASLRLKTQEGIVGYVLLGPKQSGGIYNSQDARLLEIIGNELAIAVQNARSFEKIAEFNVTLQKRIQEATYQLQAQNKRLKELDEAKDEFISMASHQLRTPLTAIKGYLSMLEEGDAGKLNEKQYEFTDSAFTSAQRMIFLISDMLNVSRINTGKLVIDKTAIDLEKVVQDEIKQLTRTAESRQVKLHYNPPIKSLPKVLLDEGKIRQVIMNFMDNSVYYAPKTTVEVTLSQMDGKVCFEVSDHGIGVPKDAQEHLFTKFYRAGNAQKARPDGTGLGLYMAKMVVEMQGGAIIFHSEEGKGSTFGFEFPLAKVQASDAKPPTAKPATPLATPAPATGRNQSVGVAKT